MHLCLFIFKRIDGDQKGSDFEFLKIGGFRYAKKPDFDKYFN
jgi:hypothetical protein